MQARTQKVREMTEFLAFVSQEWLLFVALTGLIALYFFVEGIKSGTAVSIHEVTRLLNSDAAVVLDVREPKDFGTGHITDAINIPYAKLKDRLTELNSHKAKTLVVVDKLGQHSGAAGRQLKAEGFNVVRLQGGLTEWQNQNLPLVKP